MTQVFIFDGTEYPKLPGSPSALIARRKLVNALRSGEYTQGHNALRTAEGFCCIGVACDIARKENEDLGHWEEEEGPNAAYTFQEGLEDAASSRCYLTPGVQDWLGVQSNNPQFLGPPVSLQDGDCTTRFSVLNDNSWTFPQIADLMEERWEMAPEGEAPSLPA